MRRGALAAMIVMASLVAAAPAMAGTSNVQHLHFKAGPFLITPGANLILVDTNKVPKPTVDGYMTRMAPNLHYALANGQIGAIPRVDVIHLHHGVWLSSGKAGMGEGNSYGPVYPFVASGEEKTVFQLPSGYGYPVGAKDFWVFNYMIHNLTAKAASVWVTYDIDFVPATSPAAAKITPVHPIWMDVMSHHIYPVFDVLQHSGRNGIYTFPDMAKNPYGGGAPLNEFTVDHPGTLVGTAGHVHPGGLYDDLDLVRAGAKPSGGAIKGPVPNSVRLFRSNAHYWDKRGPISWDMAMGATPPNWRAQVKAGDVMRISATYETKRASWYESMGIMIAWEAWNDTSGVDPFSHALDQTGHLTHGHLAENNHHGGSITLGVNAMKFKSCATSKVVIGGFRYTPGDFSSSGGARCAPTIHAGQALTFTNDDASSAGPGGNGLAAALSPGAAYLASIFHTVTSCQDPCGLDTGISYPLANGPGGYDSTQLGVGTPASGKLTWSTPTNLPPGTYTYFCRIHPFMRGVFRVVR